MSTLTGFFMSSPRKELLWPPARIFNATQNFFGPNEARIDTISLIGEAGEASLRPPRLRTARSPEIDTSADLFAG